MSEKKLLVFGGTEDGRRLAERLAEAGREVLLCVATEYGREQVADRPGLEVRAGRMTAEEMSMLMSARPFEAVIDATHPYATEVTANIKAAADRAGLDDFRMLRPSTAEPGAHPDWTEAADVAEAVEWLRRTPGAVLLTTGSKDLAQFAGLEDYRERLYPRILPNLDSLSHALELGYPGKHLICMQGPFSEALNTAMLRQIGAAVLVTKDTGTTGGFEEKVRAARAAGAHLLVIRRPGPEAGWTAEALLDRFGTREEANT